MKDDYAPRICIPLPAETLVDHPAEMPELVHMHDPAWMVLTDFSRIKPGVIAADVPIDVALTKMRASGLCMLLVTDEAGAEEFDADIADPLAESPTT